MRLPVVRRSSRLLAATAALALALSAIACSDESTIGPGKVALIRISPDTVRLVAGGTDTVRAFPIDNEGAFLPRQKVTWVSSDPAIALVDDEGTVTGVALGEADLTATAGSITSSVRAMVTPAPVITLDVDSLELNIIAQSDGGDSSTVAITNGGGGLLNDLTVGTIIYEGASSGWVTASLDGAVAPAVLRIVAAPGVLPVGTYVASIPVVSNSAPNSPLPVKVVLVLGSDVATAVISEAGDNQTGAAGAAVTVPPAVRVTDQYGNPVAGETVTFAIGSGGGSLTGAAPVSGADGIATIGSWTLGPTVGANSLTATAPGLTGSPIAFNATSTAGAASQIAINSGNGQTVVAGQPVVTAPSVLVRDAFNNPVAGVAVTFAVASGGGSITGGAQATNASGLATVGSWTLGTVAGANALSVTSTGLAGSPLSVTATGTAGTATTVAVNAGNAQSAAAGTAVPVAPSARVTDANGNGVAGVTVTFQVTNGAGSLTGAAPVTNAAGVATVTSWTLGAAVGPNALSATAPGLTGSPLAFTATGVTGAATVIAVSAGDNQGASAGSPAAINPAVLITDAFGNPVPGVAVTFAVALGGGSITGGGQSTNASGSATVGSWTLGPIAGVNTLTATSTGLTGSPITFTATGNPGNATTIALVGGGGQSGTVGATLATALSVLVTDNLANPVAGVTVGWASSSGSLTPASSVTNGSGIATTSWTLGTAPGAVTATASVGGLTGSPVGFGASANVGAPTQITISAGNGQSATVNTAVAIAPSVRVADLYSNPIAGASVTFGVTLGAGSVSGGTPVTDASGIATITSWTLGTGAGSNTLSATTAGAGSIGFSAIGTAGVATQIGVNAGNGQSATVATTVATAPRVLVRDAFNNPVSNVSVTFTVTGGGGQVTGGSQTTDVSGLAQATSWTLGQTAGANMLSATSTGLTGSPLPFTATGTAGAVTTIVANGSFPSTGTAGLAYAPDPSVIARDQYSNAVASSVITFTRGGSSTVNCGSGATTVCTVTTNGSGVATLTAWVLGAAAGSNSVSATRVGATGVTFSVTGNPGPVSFFSASGGGTARPGSTAPSSPSVIARDQFSNPVPSVLVSFSVTAGGGALFCSSYQTTCTATTNASGVASITFWRYSNGGSPSLGTYSNQVTVSRSGASDGTISGTAQYSFASDVQPIWTSFGCAGCHPSPYASNPASPSTMRGIASIYACTSFSRVAINLGNSNAGNSSLYFRLAGAGCGIQMPQGGPYLSAAQVNVVRDWINNNSPTN